mgnify:CR=1 FL=1
MKVVIVGAGFAGLQCAQRLSGKPVDVLLIDRNNYHAFTPLLYQVASALLNPSETLIAQTLVWAAGVKPVELDTALDVRRTRFQRIAVDPCLRIPDCPGAFAIGDVAGVTQDGGELAMMLP